MVKIYDFDVLFTCRHEECGEEIKETAIMEVQKLSKYHSHIIDGTIIIDRQNSSNIVEVSIRVPGHTFRASHIDYNLSTAIDAAIEKAKTQLKKLKSRVVDHRIPPQQLEVEVVESEETGDSE